MNNREVTFIDSTFSYDEFKKYKKIEKISIINSFSNDHELEDKKYFPKTLKKLTLNFNEDKKELKLIKYNFINDLKSLEQLQISYRPPYNKEFFLDLNDFSFPNNIKVLNIDTYSIFMKNCKFLESLQNLEKLFLNFIVINDNINDIDKLEKIKLPKSIYYIYIDNNSQELFKHLDEKENIVLDKLCIKYNNEKIKESLKTSIITNELLLYFRNKNENISFIKNIKIKEILFVTCTTIIKENIFPSYIKGLVLILFGYQNKNIISNLNNLEYLKIEQNNIDLFQKLDDITIPSSIKKLEIISTSFKYIKRLDFLTRLTNLEELSINTNFYLTREHLLNSYDDNYSKFIKFPGSLNILKLNHTAVELIYYIENIYKIKKLYVDDIETIIDSSLIITKI